jgi:transposase
MEPTGHYWINLSTWLFKHRIEVVTVNPHLVKRNKENLATMSLVMNNLDFQALHSQNVKVEQESKI